MGDELNSSKTRNQLWAEGYATGYAKGKEQAVAEAIVWHLQPSNISSDIARPFDRELQAIEKFAERYEYENVPESQVTLSEPLPDGGAAARLVGEEEVARVRSMVDARKVRDFVQGVVYDIIERNRLSIKMTENDIEIVVDGDYRLFGYPKALGIDKVFSLLERPDKRNDIQAQAMYYMSTLSPEAKVQERIIDRSRDVLEVIRNLVPEHIDRKKVNMETRRSKGYNHSSVFLVKPEYEIINFQWHAPSDGSKSLSFYNFYVSGSGVRHTVKSPEALGEAPFARTIQRRIEHLNDESILEEHAQEAMAEVEPVCNDTEPVSAEVKPSIGFTDNPPSNPWKSENLPAQDAIFEAVKRLTPEHARERINMRMKTLSSQTISEVFIDTRAMRCGILEFQYYPRTEDKQPYYAIRHYNDEEVSVIETAEALEAFPYADPIQTRINHILDTE